MQPMLRQVPPNCPRLSMQALFSPSCPARIAALYPPGPPPITTTSKRSLIHLLRCHPGENREPARFEGRGPRYRCFRPADDVRNAILSRPEIFQHLGPPSPRDADASLGRG